MKGDLSFRELYRAVTGHESPYPYQEKPAREGVPELLDVPTVVIPWVLRRQFHHAPPVRIGESWISLGWGAVDVEIC